MSVGKPIWPKSFPYLNRFYWASYPSGSGFCPLQPQFLLSSNILRICGLHFFLATILSPPWGCPFLALTLAFDFSHNCTHFFLWWLRQWRTHLQCRRPRFNPWVAKIAWKKKWQPTPVFLPRESHGHRSLAGYGLTKLGHDRATNILC